jgi:hypothetical protein
MVESKKPKSSLMFESKARAYPRVCKPSFRLQILVEGVKHTSLIGIRKSFTRLSHKAMQALSFFIICAFNDESVMITKTLPMPKIYGRKLIFAKRRDFFGESETSSKFFCVCICILITSETLAHFSSSPLD